MSGSFEIGPLSQQREGLLLPGVDRRRSADVTVRLDESLLTAHELERQFPNIAFLLTSMPEDESLQQEIIRLQITQLNTEQPDLGGGSKRLASRPFDERLLTVTAYTYDQLVELDQRLGIVMQHIDQDYGALLTAAQESLRQRELEIESLQNEESVHSVNATNVDHILDWLHDHADPDIIQQLLVKTGYDSEAQLREIRALTLEEFGVIVDAYWELIGTATAVYDLGLSIQVYGYGAGWRAAQMGKAGFSPADGFRLFKEQVIAFNSNKGFEYREPAKDMHLYGQFDALKAEYEEHIIDMFNFPHVDAELDIQSRLYIQGILESVLLGYGLQKGLIQPLILQQPIPVFIDYLDRMRLRGVPGIPELGRCRIDSATGDFLIGDTVYGYAAQEREDWHEQEDWLNPPRERRRDFLEEGKCLVKFTRNLTIDPPTDKQGIRRSAVLLIARDGIGAMHRLPTSRFRIINKQVSKVKHLPVALGNQLILLGKDVARGFGQLVQLIREHGLSQGINAAFHSTVADKHATWKSIAMLRRETMISAGQQWIYDRRNSLSQEYNELIEAAASLQNALKSGGIPDDANRELLKKMNAFLGEFHEESAKHVGRVKTVSVDLATLLLTDPYLRERYKKSLSDANFLQDTELAADMHDVGKLGVPGSVVLCQQRFTNRQAFQMQAHALLSRKILLAQPSQRLRKIAVAAGAHHEKWNGTGYPDGLAGDDIPFEAQIIAVADVFDALGGHEEEQEKREYQQSIKPRPVILRIFRDDTLDGQFNPLVVVRLFELANLRRPLNIEEESYYEDVLGHIKREFPEAA